MDPFDLRKWEHFEQAGGSLSHPAIIDQIAIDSRSVDSGRSLFVALKGKNTDGHFFVAEAALKGAKYAIVSKDWEPSHPIENIILLKVDTPLKALQSIAKAYRKQLPTKLVGITGSFGKTMVKDLLQALLSTSKATAASPGSFNSQIGVPLSLFRLQSHHEIGLIEAAISECNEMDSLAEMIAPDYTLLTPLGRKHLATLKTVSNLTEETCKLLKKTPTNGWSLISTGDGLHSIPSQVDCKKYAWDVPEVGLPHATPCELTPLTHYFLSFPDGNSYRGEIRSGQAHFLNLINMATKAAWLLQIPSGNIISVLKTYQPEVIRTEIWKSTLGTLFINDTSSSDPQSIETSLNYFENHGQKHRRIFVFSGMKHSFSETCAKRIALSVALHGIDHFIMIGHTQTKTFLSEIKHHSPKIEISHFDDIEDCFEYLKSYLNEEDTVLLKGKEKISLDTLILSFNESLPNNLCTINLAAIKENLKLIRGHLKEGTRIMAMVKALAYGTDDVQVSKFLLENGVDILGVSYVDEAIALKKSGVSQKIFSLNAAPYEIKKVVKWDIEVGISDSEFTELLEEEAKATQKTISVHLHVNTGMGRFGCPPDKALELAKQITKSPHLVLEGIMTHFACAEDPNEDSFTMQQIRLFNETIASIEKAGIELKWKHAANSSAALRFHTPEYNMVRLGLAMYGLYTSNTVQKTLDLKLAVSLSSRVVGITECEKGDSIGYGRKYIVQNAKQKIAILPIGYFDGLHRNYSSKGFVLIRGKPAPMVGNICMDFMMVDVTHIKDIEVGDLVLIFGENEHGDYLCPEELALSGNSIVHELITCLGPRILRLFILEEGNQIR